MRTLIFTTAIVLLAISFTLAQTPRQRLKQRRDRIDTALAANKAAQQEWREVEVDVAKVLEGLRRDARAIRALDTTRHGMLALDGRGTTNPLLIPIALPTTPTLFADPQTTETAEIDSKALKTAMGVTGTPRQAAKDRGGTSLRHLDDLRRSPDPAFDPKRRLFAWERRQ